MNISELRRSLLTRTSELAKWFAATLEISESRAERDIERLLRAIAEYARKEGLTDDGLFMLWDMFEVESTQLVDDSTPLEANLGVTCDPRLEVAEYALLIGLHLARSGVVCLQSNSHKQHLLAAHLLANAIEARGYWMATRGITRCRNPISSFVRAEETLQKRESETWLRKVRSQSARRAALAKHEMPGGSRDNKERIRSIWATGKYSSRDICAEQECAALGMSLSTARKALRNTPDPT